MKNHEAALAALGPRAELREQVRYTRAIADRGYRLNRLISGLTQIERRERFRADPEAYMKAEGLPHDEMQLMLNKDCMGLFDHGVNIYAVAKAGTILGVPLPEIGAAMKQRGARQAGDAANPSEGQQP